ncbi:hypothetical protein HS041_27725 [Planomonospora sp. ID67723]|uniref:hypothetical protein n=1 Tax=Planomonospora sp. ID67723 TaxID=2738134 RepID=UPI0018C38B85|nr:hypothetical protein [Planomonospora sp. ID67723]MBG0831531.1 hypothetical protein [Planomonospora sp. ID67723]
MTRRSEDARPRSTLHARLPGDTVRTGAMALINDMAEGTGIPLALGLARVLDGTARTPGIHPPEIAINADRFFRDLAHHTAGAPPPPSGDGVLVDRSAAPPR